MSKIRDRVWYIERRIRRIWCWLTWHKWKRGTNGWENLGTGLYCSCGKMYNDPYVK